MAQTPHRWQRIEALYHAALERDPVVRTVFLDGACGEDADLRREVESLLTAPATGEELPDQPAIALTPGSRLGPYEILSRLGRSPRNLTNCSGLPQPTSTQ